MSRGETAQDLSLLRELASFLGPMNRQDVRAQAAQNLAALSAQPNALSALAWNESGAIDFLVKWLGDVDSVAKPCGLALVNLSAVGYFNPKSKAVAAKPMFWRWLLKVSAL